VAIVRYVNTASTAGGDGTTNGTAGATRAYASLREALTAQPGTLLDQTTIYCEGTAADTLSCTQAIWDFQTSATNYLRIVGNNTSGKWDTTKYRIQVSDEGGIYNNNAGHVRLEYLQVQVTVTTSSGATYSCFRLATANNLNGPVAHSFTGCYSNVVVSGGATDNVFGFIDSDPTIGGTCKRINCIAWRGYCGFSSDGTAWGTSNLYNLNCTAYGNEIAYLDAQICVNCLGANSTLGAGVFLSTGSAGHSNNAADEASAVGANARINQTFTFLDTATGDFHLSRSDAGAQGYGLDLSFWGVTDDVDGRDRFGAWDIGADQVDDPPIRGVRTEGRFLHDGGLGTRALLNVKAWV
jgi:hypothetical protein